ncbi:hypothetical protein AHEV_005 [Adoxophyes honmai entomopoxvirus 'L']|uniref:Caspase-like protein n=1 Tax=Adoxophyes honmai entomopoxvirus 'L' TaxID=1293540 RepID=A0A916KNT9_9POXV|nr:hypothetical protein AHEV_005 [Adoxophyes honmai entomopoxvirus 'L']CCU55326.1 hypothetical protein AHEV_005 [Adoxophyes honmai entomopoxvirus 'L']
MVLIINQTNSMVERDITPIKSLFKNIHECDNLTKDEIINVINAFCENNNKQYIVIFIFGDADSNGNVFDVNKEKYSLSSIFKHRRHDDTPLILITDLCVPNDCRISIFNICATINNSLLLNLYHEPKHRIGNDFIDILSKELKQKDELEDICRNIRREMAFTNNVMPCVRSTLCVRVYDIQNY